MSQMMDKTTENSDEDRVSIKSNGRTASNGKTPSIGGMKDTLGKSFRNSMRRVKEMSPLSSGGKGSKVTTGNDSGLQPPPSPSLSAGSPVMSPLRNIGGLFHKKEEDENDVSSQKGKGLTRSKTDPNMGLTDALIKRGGNIRRSLTFRKKKDNTCKQPASVEEMKEDKEEEEEVVVWEEMEESYTLPEIPHTPLSVMQINKLIEMEVLEESHLNLLALRKEFQQEQERCSEDSPMELAKKEKDLNLLYGEMRNKFNTIVRDSNSLPSRNKGLLVHVARIIQEEERRAEEPGGLQGSWMEAWREAVGEGVQVKVEGVHLDRREQNTSWLAVHLGLLGKAIVEDLENVKKELRWSYPPSFKVFSTYVRSYHKVTGQHLKKLEPQVTELKDLHALLDWIINRYKSERIMGNLSLQPDMKDESAELQLEDDLLKKLKDKYCCKVKEELRCSLERIIELENEEVWSERKTPEKEDEFLNSDLHMDVWTKVKGYVVNSRLIDAQLEQKVISSCLQELNEFPKRFEAEFRRHCSELRPQPLWTEYHITYINSFTALQQHMEEYRDACPDEVDRFDKEAKWLIIRLIQVLEDHFKEDVKPYLRRMMTRKWLTIDEDFEQLYSRTELLSHHCALMSSPHAQEFASRLHYHVVREYVGQLMKSNYSCKNRKHEKAGNKICGQWGRLRDLFEDMNSTHEWLHDVGDNLGDIIRQKSKTDIKNHLQPLVEHYPDFSRKHLVAVLYFRGLMRGREHQLILQRLTELKKNLGSVGGDNSRVLFGDMQVTVNTDCLSNLPFSCLSFLLPDN
ncbi:exocyst complex component 3-like protein 4 [Centropristis striata]|uniref:exocyst complex component 3-like protein 4 n=1 Tax=Centropristis striata TaxID=184440 RepID=UPI0027E0ABB9|nr:exocyst complex component 3-like protein 4 [Centropristis striata]XP_059209240.1 exocyst complex component 3-like protein 4 [Centropristis striata]XP_059209241.1 exocyst complex component 3-like protein 4 [Centropristis striata]XP_059209243.1 exocyst complex component 3-like protein 4 [Centropristis striata]XP_059209244.1 exocyst complex component 3-like protein 4 [Centropristis striata]